MIGILLGLAGFPGVLLTAFGGSMATIGRHAAVAKMGILEFTGYPAWVAWLLVHLIFLIGFRNKLAVLGQWIYGYVMFKRGARIVSGGNGNPG